MSGKKNVKKGRETDRLDDAVALTSEEADFFDPIRRHARFWSDTFEPELMPFVVALQRAHDAKMARAGCVLQRHGLSVYEFDVLASLRRGPPPFELTPKDLQRSLVITSGGLTKVLRQLEARGLVERRVNVEDRRVKPVRLSPLACALVERALAELIERVGGWYRSVLSPDDIAHLTRLLKKLGEAGACEEDGNSNVD